MSAPRIHDREAKVRKRRGRMKLNGRSLKTLLTERAAKAQSTHTTKATKGGRKATPSR